MSEASIIPTDYPTQRSAVNEQRRFALPNSISKPLLALAGYGDPIVTGITAGILAFIGLTVAYVFYVQVFYVGMWGGPFLCSTSFSIPRASAEAGVLPVCQHPDQGWDGQFYYHQSNDPFL